MLTVQIAKYVNLLTETCNTSSDLANNTLKSLNSLTALCSG